MPICTVCSMVANRTLLKNNVAQIESKPFEAVTGQMNSVEASLFSTGNHKLLFVMNQNPNKRSGYILHTKKSCEFFKIVVRDIFPNAKKTKIVGFTKIQPGKSLSLKAGEAVWILVGDAAKAASFCDQVRKNLLELECRMASTYTDQYSGLKSKESQYFIDSYKQRLNEALPQELESLLRSRHRFMAEAERQNPHVSKIRNQLLAIRNRLSDLDEQLCTPDIPFQSKLHQQIVSILHREGKDFLTLFHLKTLYDKDKFLAMEAKLESLYCRIIKKAANITIRTD